MNRLAGRLERLKRALPEPLTGRALDDAIRAELLRLEYHSDLPALLAEFAAQQCTGIDDKTDRERV